jgi:hypothetical protein
MESDSNGKFELKANVEQSKDRKIPVFSSEMYQVKRQSTNSQMQKVRAGVQIAVQSVQVDRRK